MDDYDDIQGLLAGILNDDEPVTEESEQEEVTAAEETQPIVITADETPTETEDSGGDWEFDELLSQFDTPDESEPEPTEVAQSEEIETVEETDTAEEMIEPSDGEDTPSLDELLADADTDDAPTATNIIFKDAPEKKGDTIPMPEFTTDDIAESLDIRNFASLVTLNTSRWSGKVKDRKASEAAAAATNAQAAAFETHKRLLAGADEKLRAVCKSIDDARTMHYSMTLPWSTVGRSDTGKRTGGRLLPHTCFQEYIKAMGKAKQVMEKLADEFEDDYADAIQKAQSNLGDRFDPTEYPNPASIRAHFDLTFDFHPIPVGSDFQGLADQQVSALSNALEKKNRVMVENAMQETWARAYELVERAAEKFSSPEAMFHYTLVDQLRDAATNLKYLNVTGDAMIEKVRATIAKHLTMHDAKDIRGDEALRLRLGKIASALLKEMRNHGTGG